MFKLNAQMLARAVPLLFALASFQLAACESDDSPSGPGAATNTDPVVEITAPAESAELWVSNYDDVLENWYIEVELTGIAVDAEDGSLDGASLVWKAQPDGGTLETLGEGRNLTTRLYLVETAYTPYTIILEATDSDGATVMTTVSVGLNILL